MCDYAFVKRCCWFVFIFQFYFRFISLGERGFKWGARKANGKRECVRERERDSFGKLIMAALKFNLLFFLLLLFTIVLNSYTTPLTHEFICKNNNNKTIKQNEKIHFFVFVFIVKKILKRKWRMLINKKKKKHEIIHNGIV